MERYTEQRLEVRTKIREIFTSTLEVVTKLQSRELFELPSGLRIAVELPQPFQSPTGLRLNTPEKSFEFSTSTTPLSSLSKAKNKFASLGVGLTR
jgi:hypothetical protein